MAGRHRSTDKKNRHHLELARWIRTLGRVYQVVLLVQLIVAVIFVVIQIVWTLGSLIYGLIVT